MSLVIENNIVMSCFPHQEDAYTKVMQGHLSRYKFKHEVTTFFSVNKDQRGSGHLLESRIMQINKDVGHVSSVSYKHFFQLSHRVKHRKGHHKSSPKN